MPRNKAWCQGGDTCQESFKPSRVGSHLLCLIRRISFRVSGTWKAFPISPCSSWCLGSRAVCSWTGRWEGLYSHWLKRSIQKPEGRGFSSYSFRRGNFIVEGRIRKGRNSCRISVPSVGLPEYYRDNSPRLTNFAQTQGFSIYPTQNTLRDWLGFTLLPRGGHVRQ